MNTRLSRDRDSSAVLDDARIRIYPVLRGAVNELPAAVRHIAGYHFGWHDRTGRPMADQWTGGKALRPALVFLAAAAVAGTGPVADLDVAIVRAGVAVELVHNFSLIHDDVMDGDAMRRHRETVWKVFGVPSAILVGDALLALATNVLTEIPVTATPIAVTMLTNAVQQLIEGQAADLSFETRARIELIECVAMAGQKTGALIACACVLGALIAGASAERVRQLHSFGMHMGVAFQLADDLLGIWGDPASTGKPEHNDLWTRKKSLPVVAALNSGTQAGDELDVLYRKTSPWEQVDVRRAATLIAHAGGREWAGAEATRRVEAALSCLDAIEPDPCAAADLAGLARLAAARDH